MERNVIAKELDAIAKQNDGRLEAEDVVAYAKRNKGSALHLRFDWSDKSAAHTQRLNVAHQLIVNMRIKVVEGPNRGVVSMRGFVNHKSDDAHVQSGYSPTLDVLEDPDRRRCLIVSLLDRMMSTCRSYDLPELDPVVRAIEKCRWKIEPGPTAGAA